jgi:hypothetical protein
VRRTIKLTERRRHFALAMFTGNDEGGHGTDNQIGELVTMIWQWQWGDSEGAP